MQRHVTIAKLLNPNKSIEKIILDYQEEKKCESNGDNIKNTTDAETERKSVPGSILYMRLNYLQPKLQKWNIEQYSVCYFDAILRRQRPDPMRRTSGTTELQQINEGKNSGGGEETYLSPKPC
jgi:hypothetical protein